MRLIFMATRLSWGPYIVGMPTKGSSSLITLSFGSIIEQTLVDMDVCLFQFVDNLF